MKKIIKQLLFIFLAFNATHIQAQQVSTYAGSTFDFEDGETSAAKFLGCSSLVMDYLGNIYVADIFNHKIRKIGGGVVATFAGSTAGYTDGRSTNAQFTEPTAVTINPATRDVFVTELNHKIRKINLSALSTEGFYENAFSVYPNPTKSDTASSLTEKNLKNTKYEIYDVNGRLLNSQQLNSLDTNIELNNYGTGMYLLEILSL